jgi:hypothetical protein
VPHRTTSRACGNLFRGTVVVEIQHWRVRPPAPGGGK